MKILSVDNLSLGFDSNVSSKNVLKNISFSLEKSKTLGIVGESGSGKSLTALSILNLLPHNAIIESGEINYFSESSNVNLLILNETEIQKVRGNQISMIFQEPMTSLNPSLKCGFQVAEIIINHLKVNSKIAKSRVLELFREVKLPEPERIYESYPHEISGGQKQRVMIAMAIALKPTILIADEPTTALDVTVQKAIIDLLKQLQLKYQMSILFISHDLGIISEIADDVLVMYQGEIVENNTALNILNNPVHPYTKGLLKCRPTLNSPKGRLPILTDFFDLNKKVDKTAPIKKSEKSDFIESVDKEILLKVEKISKSFDVKKNLFARGKNAKQVIRNFSFNLYKGETLGLVGESGCGKTTLGRIIAQLIESNSGHIAYKGFSLNKLSKTQLKEFRKSVQVIFQDPYSSLNPKLTVGQILIEPLIAHYLYKGFAEKKAKVFEMMSKVRLDPESFNKYPHQFSGGQRQRIVIARALILQPEFVICDESVSALDVSIQAEILNLLNELKKEFSLTYIFISHDLSVVKYMSDRIMVMNNGELVEINKADDLYKSPASDYTKKLINSIPQIQS